MRGETPYFIFRHIWDTTSQRLNSKKGTSSPNPSILDLGCKPQSLKYSFRYHKRTQLKALILLRENTEQNLNGFKNTSVLYSVTDSYKQAENFGEADPKTNLHR